MRRHGEADRAKWEIYVFLSDVSEVSVKMRIQMPGRPVLTRLANYDALYGQFRWPAPALYNIGVEVCDRWAGLDPGRTALIDVHDDGHCDEISYGALRDGSNRLANTLRAFGVIRGDRVA